MSGWKKGFRWFWRIMLFSMFLIFLFRNVKPLKTINEMYSAPWYLLMLVSFISGAVWFTLAFREGKVIRREIIAKRKDVGDQGQEHDAIKGGELMVGGTPAPLTVIISLAILMTTTYRSLRTLMAAFLLLLDRMSVSRRLRLRLPSGIITRWRELQTRNLLHLDTRNEGFDKFTREG